MTAKRRARGEGSLSQRKSGLWVASVPTGDYDAAGRMKRKQRTSMDYTVAVEHLRQLQRDLEAGILTTVTNSTKLSDWLDTWLDTIAKPAVKPTVLSTYRATINSQISPRIGRHRIDKLTPQHIRKMNHDIAVKKSSGYALNAYRLLSKALGDAKREGLIRDNPCERVPAPKVIRTQRGVHTSEAVRKVIQHLVSSGDIDELARWTTTLMTGIRQAEAIGLTWDRVDFEQSTIDISLSLQRIKLAPGPRPDTDIYPRTAFDVDPGFDFTPVWRGWCLIDTKTTSSRRLVPMVTPLHAALLAHWESQGTPSEGLVWQRPGGRPWDKGDDEKRWKAMLAAAGVEELTQHSARHTVATLLQSAGVPEATRMAILGHSTATMARHYAHVDHTLTRDALGQLEQILAADAATD